MEEQIVWKCTVGNESCHFGDRATAKAWGRGLGVIEEIRIKGRERHLRAVPTESDEARELRELKALMAELLVQLGERDRGDGNAPGHAHEVPGVWDSDNGKLAGKPCAWCKTWAKAKALGLTPNACGEPGHD